MPTYYYGKKVDPTRPFTKKERGALITHAKTPEGVACGRKRVKWATDEPWGQIACYDCRQALGFPSAIYTRIEAERYWEHYWENTEASRFQTSGTP